MWNFNLIVIFLLAGTYLVSAQEEQTDEEKQKECAYLNSVRANYTACCEYPIFVIWMWQYKICKAKCAVLESKYWPCCEAKCQYVDQQGLLTLVRKEDGTYEKTEMNPSALAFSFLISVGNDTQWEPIIKSAVQRCYDDLWGASEGKIFCGFIPNTLFDIINCCYNEHYLKCPTWNPHGLVECDYTYKFAVNCW